MTDVAGVSLNFSEESNHITPALAALIGRVSKLDDALDEIGASNVTETQMRFEQKLGPDGTPWVALSDVTKAKKQRAGAGGEAQILRDGGDLYDSLTHQVKRGEGVMVGVTRVYGRIHQLGGMAGRGLKVRIPARPYLGVSRDGEEEIALIVGKHLEGRAA